MELNFVSIYIPIIITIIVIILKIKCGSPTQ